MSYVVVGPEIMAAAATDVAAVGSTLHDAHMAAAASTVGVIPAAADEVSARVAQLFSRYAQDFQALAGKGAAFHEQFVHNLTASAHSYVATEAGNVASLFQHLSASARSSASAAATSPSNLLTFLQTAINTLGAELNTLASLLQGLLSILKNLPAFLVGLAAIIAYLHTIKKYVHYVELQLLSLIVQFATGFGL